MASQRLFSIAILFLMITSSASCFSLTIDQAWQLAKKHDPDYEMAQLDLQIGETDVSVNRSALLPSLDAKASSSWNPR